MTLNRVYDDIALDLPLNDTAVYFSDDMKYKVIISSPFKHLGRETKLISIGRCPYDKEPPSGYICKTILKMLHFDNAVSAPEFPDFKSGVIRFLSEKLY
jgi:hypothetical protein